MIYSGRLLSTRKRVIATRQIVILNCLLDESPLELDEIRKRTRHLYQPLKNPWRAVVRDILYLVNLRAIELRELDKDEKVWLSVRLDWPTEITETVFFERVTQSASRKDLQVPTEAARI